jgi:hypothetical protein
MDTFAFAVWVGGLAPAYRNARKNGHGRLNSFFLQSPFWPMELGWELARRVTASDKE